MIDWKQWAPLDNDVQNSRVVDFQACTDYATVHAFEMWLRKQTGTFWEFSERAQATLSGTTTQGNSLQNNVDALNRVGLISVADWPALTYSSSYDNVTWAQYYTPIPQVIQNRRFKVHASLNKLTSWSDITDNLKYYPNLVIIKITDTVQHCVVRMNIDGGQWKLGQYYDSYELRIKDFQPSEPIVSEWALIIKPQFMIPSIKTVKFLDGKTMGVLIDTTNGTQIIKATDEARWRSWSAVDSYGKPTVNPDGSTNWNADLNLNF